MTAPSSASCLRRLKDRKLNRNAPSNPAFFTVVAKVVTLRSTLPAGAEVDVWDAGAGTVRTVGDRPQSISEDGEAQLNVIVPWKPLIAVTVTGVAPVLPWATENGETARLKSWEPRTLWEIAGDVLPRRLESPV